MPALLQGGPGTPWPAGAVHDSVAAIASSPEYTRSITESLWAVFWRRLSEALDALFEFFRGSASGRWVTMSLIALLIILVVARAYMAAKAARERALHDVAGGRGVTRAHPWLDAQRLAAAGNFTDAAHALLAALLAAIAAQGQLRLHSSKTAGDYSRELRRRAAPAHFRFESFRKRYEVAIYGRGEVTASEYEGLLDEARPLIEGARAALEGARAA